MKRTLSKWLNAAALLAAASWAMAAPYSVTYTSTIVTNSVLPAGINSGEQFTLKLVLDNGNSSTANQTWSAGTVQCTIFTFNNAQDKFVAVNYVGQPFTSDTAGNFTTNGTGQLQAGVITWDDLSDPITNPSATNIAGTSIYDWFINGSNDVIFWNGIHISAGFSSVANDTQVANWSNPVPAAGACAGFFAPQTSQPIPTLGDWALVVLAGLLALGTVVTLRRRRQ